MDAYDFSTQAAQEAGELIMRLRKETFTITTKSNDPRNIVTSVDFAVNDFLVSQIKNAYPADSLYSEESGGTLRGGRMWVVDPIDGSSNFSRAIPHFAVCLGLLEDGVPAAGAVYNPATQELFSFKKGMGAFLNGTPIHVSKIADLSQAGVFLHAGRRKELWDWGAAGYRKLFEHTNKVSNFAASALDTCFVAAGRIEANIYGTLTTMDIAAALGILAEAGGVALTDTGEPAKLSTQPQKIYVANSEQLAQKLRELLG